ncbi:MAG: hypothetical protein ACE5K3_04455 [bacterium]
MPERESEIAKWIKELEERRAKLDLQIDELDLEIARIEWRMTQLRELRRKTEEGAIQVAQPQVIAEKTQQEIKNLARLKGERRERKGEIAGDRDFYSALVSYLRSQLESAPEKPSAG